MSEDSAKKNVSAPIDGKPVLKSAQSLSEFIAVVENLKPASEAIEWAVSRLRARPERRKILLMISDGAPVDDSTLMENDKGILERHLQHIVAEILAKGDIQLGAAGISARSSEWAAGEGQRHIHS